MQPTDFTTLTAVCSDLRRDWIPSRLEQVYQLDRYTISLCLRTLTKKGWLTISWHPQGARICLSSPPPRLRDTFTFSEQLRHQLNGHALTALKAIAPWERVVDFQFAKRLGENPCYHLNVEIMGKYSNVILTDANNQIITVAHQVTAKKSTVRTVETGQPYQIPPPLTGATPKLNESFHSWQERVSLIPGRIDKQMLKVYRGLSPIVVRGMLSQANLDCQQLTENLSHQDWQNLYKYWQQWLEAIEKEQFQAGWTKSGYTVLNWDIQTIAANLHSLLDTYYKNQLQQETFQQLRHQLTQKISNILSKLKTKGDVYGKRLEQSQRGEEYRQKGDLLMANLHQWQPGMKSIILNDFETNEHINISLDPEKNAIQNAQALYKQHQKLKRAKSAVEPLLEEVIKEINYLTQVETAVTQLDCDSTPEDLQTLLEIKEELIAEKYFEDSQYAKSPQKQESQPYRYLSPSGFEVLIGRNNRQNDRLTFRTATDYDLWFHSQEIPGSHVLLRLKPGAIPDREDLNFTANLAAYYSQGRESQQIPIVYTKPKSVYKPKGAKPGMAIYKKETIIWGYPQEAKVYLSQQGQP
jgi:predicted ribosome quality control (RQC) complex YloA/Tae2 family protein